MCVPVCLEQYHLCYQGNGLILILGSNPGFLLQICRAALEEKTKTARQIPGQKAWVGGRAFTRPLVDGFAAFG